MTVQKVQVKYYLFADLNQTFPLHINLKHSLTTTLIQTGTFHTRLQGHDDMCTSLVQQGKKSYMELCSISGTTHLHVVVVV